MNYIKNYVILLLFFLSIVKVGAQCSANFTPDMALPTSDASIQTEIDNIYTAAKNKRLASSSPSITDLNDAITEYNNLNIVVNSGNITGTPITSYSTVSFIGIFADYLNFNPADTAMSERVNNTVWWTYSNICDNTLSLDFAGYEFRNFSRKGFFCVEFLTPENQDRIMYIMEKQTKDWGVFWKPNYDEDSQLSDGTTTSDLIHNILDAFVPLVKCFETGDHQYRYMLTLKRYVSRFASVYTNGTHDGIKLDGSGYHHWNNYEAYMYAYNNVVNLLKHLDNTSFQISSNEYLVFRNSVIHKYLNTNDDGYLPLTITGRSGNWERINFSQHTLKNLAVIGGNILGLATADPILAGIYNRRYGVDASFNYTTSAPFHDGFYQNNHATTGIFRTNNTVICSRGFNDTLWGSEIYATENRYGRYQSYGSLVIVYPGDRDANGFDNTKWDWNHNPGTTTKLLSWSELIAPNVRIDEYSDKNFAGSLQFNLQNKGFLDNVFGTYGMFAMDFQEKQGSGFGTSTATETHDPTFTFKKSNFYFDDMIICLGSDINNTDSTHNTVTTLYQNSTNPSNVTVNNSIYSTTGITSTYSESNDNWVLDNFGTGFYIVKESGELNIQRKDQETPSHDQTDPTVLNPIAQAAIGYMNHGVAPSNEGYEYVVLPNTNASAMQSLATSFSNPLTKPFEVLNKDNSSHIIKHNGTGIYGLALFEANSTIPGNTNIISNEYPCLLMYESLNSDQEMKLSLSNPDMGLSNAHSYEKYPTQPIEVTFDGLWELSESHSDISLVSVTANTTTFSFLTYQGLPIEANFHRTSPLFIDRVNNTENFMIYPNPSQYIVYVKNIKIDLSLSNTKIYNFQGLEFTNLIFIQNNAIDISKLPSGTYILKVNNLAKIIYKIPL
jgi:chondroitin-sulfate-ABC endolyase/exolyase